MSFLLALLYTPSSRRNYVSVDFELRCSVCVYSVVFRPRPTEVAAFHSHRTPPSREQQLLIDDELVCVRATWHKIIRLRQSEGIYIQRQLSPPLGKRGGQLRSSTSINHKDKQRRQTDSTLQWFTSALIAEQSRDSLTGCIHH